MNKKTYLNSKKLIRKFIDKGYWHLFNSGDIFYFNRPNKIDSMFTFVETMIDDSFGGQIFIGKDAFNYVHDLLTTNSQVVTMYDCNAILFSIKNRNEMTDFEKDYFKENNMRIMNENNLIIYRYIPGRKIRMANDIELEELHDHLSYLNSIIEGEYDKIIEAFKKNLCVYSIIDDVNYTYEMILRPLPYLETKERLYKANKEFALEFKDTEFINSDCYLFLNYAPLVIKGKDIRPLMFYFFFPKEKKHFFRYMTVELMKNKNMIYGILDEAFNEIGKPYKIYINNRFAYAYLHKTLDLLNIENEFLREEKSTDDNIDLLMSGLYKPNIDEIIEEDDLVSDLMDVIEKTLSTLNDNVDLIEDDDKPTLEFVS